jgi:hypothetical protein
MDENYRTRLDRVDDLNRQLFKAELRKEFGSLRGVFHAEFSKLYPWMFFYWFTLMLTLFGIFFGFMQRR